MRQIRYIFTCSLLLHTRERLGDIMSVLSISSCLHSGYRSYQILPQKSKRMGQMSKSFLILGHFILLTCFIGVSACSRPSVPDDGEWKLLGGSTIVWSPDGSCIAVNEFLINNNGTNPKQSRVRVICQRNGNVDSTTIAKAIFPCWLNEYQLLFLEVLDNKSNKKVNISSYDVKSGTKDAITTITHSVTYPVVSISSDTVLFIAPSESNTKFMVLSLANKTFQEVDKLPRGVLISQIDYDLESGHLAYYHPEKMALVVQDTRSWKILWELLLDFEFDEVEFIRWGDGSHILVAFSHSSGEHFDLISVDITSKEIRRILSSQYLPLNLWVSRTGLASLVLVDPQNTQARTAVIDWRAGDIKGCLSSEVRVASVSSVHSDFFVMRKGSDPTEVFLTSIELKQLLEPCEEVIK